MAPAGPGANLRFLPAARAFSSLVQRPATSSQQHQQLSLLSTTDPSTSSLRTSAQWLALQLLFPSSSASLPSLHSHRLDTISNFICFFCNFWIRDSIFQAHYHQAFIVLVVKIKN